MTEAVFAALQDAVRLAREKQVQSLERLRMLLAEHGHATTDVDSAFAAWAGSLLKRKG